MHIILLDTFSSKFHAKDMKGLPYSVEVDELLRRLRFVRYFIVYLRVDMGILKIGFCLN